jgi:tetratricopeptide (TPR) repeat protein
MPQVGRNGYLPEINLATPHITLSPARIAGITLWCAGLCAGTVHPQSAPAVPNATVTADTLVVYSEMRVATTNAVGSLKKGDHVIVDYEFKTSAEQWCRVRIAPQGPRMGYVQCAGLKRKQEAAPTAAEPTPGSAAARRAANNLPLAPPPPRTTGGYEEIANLVVREGAIDVVKLAELDALARGSSPTAVRRASLAHYAAANFELLRNSDDEAIEQYQSALSLAGKQPDIQVASLMRLAYIHLRHSEYSDALGYLDRARTVEPRSVGVARLSGWAYYGLDRLDEAVAQWTIAQRIQPDPDVARLLEKTATDKEAESGFRSGQTTHFTLHYEGSATPQLAAEILNTLEDDFRSIQAELHFAPQEPVAVVLYTQQSFRDITRAPSWAGAWNDGRIRVPVQGLTSIDNQLSRVLKHELTHSFVRQKTQGHCPQWLHEGLAQWMEGRRSDAAAQPLVAAYDRRQYPPLRALEGSWVQFSGPQAAFAYAWSLAAVEYIVANSGMWGIERLLDTLAGGSPVQPAIGSALQTDYAGIEQGTADYLRQTYLH